MRECYNKQLGSDKGVTIALGEEGSPLPRVHINRSWVEVSHQIHPNVGVGQTDPFTGFYHGNGHKNSTDVRGEANRSWQLQKLL